MVVNTYMHIGIKYRAGDGEWEELPLNLKVIKSKAELVVTNTNFKISIQSKAGYGGGGGNVILTFLRKLNRHINL